MLYKHPRYLLKLLSSNLLIPQEKKPSSSVPKFTCKAGWYIHTQGTRETHRAGKWNLYKLLHKGDPKANFLLAFLASSTVGICAHGNTAVLMEISKQGHTCHRSCFSCSKNICGSWWLERQWPLLVLPVVAGCFPCTYSPQCAQGSSSHSLLNLLSIKLESKIITANFPPGPSSADYKRLWRYSEAAQPSWEMPLTEKQLFIIQLRYSTRWMR